MDIWVGEWIYGQTGERKGGSWLQTESFPSGFISSINLEVFNLDLSVGSFWGSHFFRVGQEFTLLYTHESDTSQNPYLLIHYVRIGISGYEFGVRDINVHLQPTMLEGSRKCPPGCELCGAVKWLFPWWVWCGEAANILCLLKIGSNV